MFEFSFHKRVRYAETDKMGYLYYGHYAKFYEIGRVETMRALGVSYRSLEDDFGIMLPVVSLESRYLRPAYYDDNIEIKSVLKEMPNKILIFYHELFNPKKELINTACVKLFFVEMQSGKRISTPSILTEKLSAYF